MKLEKLNFMVHISLEWRSKLTFLEATVEFQKDFVKQNGDIFLEQKAFIMLQQKNWSIRIGLIHQRNTMKNHTERAFLRSHRITCDQMGYIYLMSRKQHYLLKDN